MSSARCRASGAPQEFPSPEEAFQAAVAHAQACGYMVDVQAYDASWRLNPPNVARAPRCPWAPKPAPTPSKGAGEAPGEPETVPEA